MTTPSISMNSDSEKPILKTDLKSLLEEETEPESAKDLTRDERAEILAWVNEQFRMCKDNRSIQERQWYINLAFYMGKQHVQYISAPGSQNSNKLTTPQAPYWRARPVINKIRPMIRKEISKITSTKPNAYVVPASSEDQDLFAAQAAEQLWESLYDSKKVQTVIRRASYWSRICGVGFIKCWWADDAIDEENKQMGDIIIESQTPFHVFVPDLTEEDLEKQAYVLHVSVKPVDWATMTYGEYLENPPQATAISESVIDSGFLKLINADVNAEKDSVEILEAWIKPGMIKKFPDGAVVTVVGGQVAQVWRGWPYKSTKYPFVKLENIPTGSFYPESVITDIIPLQREYNRTHGQIIEAKNRMAKPQLIAPKGSINPAQITTEPGQVILYKAGFTPPQPLPLQPLPNYVLEELDRIQQDMNDISSQHEVSKGATPPGVTAATAISYLQEQDDTVLSHSLESLENGVQKMAQMTLSYIEQFWSTQRQVKVVGTDGSFDVIMLKGADINGNTDIRIEKDSALPTSRAAKQAFILDLMKMGFIDPNKGLEVMEIGGINKVYEAIHVDVRQAQRENLRMQTTDENTVAQFVEAQANYNEMVKMGMPEMGIPPGMPPPDPENPMQPLQPPPPPIPVNSWDNHESHIEIHNKFRKSQTFEALPDEIKQSFEAHVQFHMIAIQGQMMDPNMMNPGMAGQEPPVDGSMPPEQPPMGGMGGPQPNG